jgi:manganese transport protein
MDPGNWSTGLRAGAGWGYAHLCVVLLSSLVGLFLQTLAVRLGVAGKRDLAQACRDALPRPLVLALWASAELAMVATDLAEVIGFAVAFQLLTGAPTWAGVVLSTGDTLLLFLLPAGGARERAIEVLSLVLVALIAGSFVVLLAVARPSGSAVMAGYLPSAPLFQGEATLVAVGILGATVMPHNLYLHSAVVRLRRVGGGGGASRRRNRPLRQLQPRLQKRARCGRRRRRRRRRRARARAGLVRAQHCSAMQARLQQ